MGHDENTWKGYELMMDRTPPTKFRLKWNPLTKMQEWREYDFKGTYKVEVKEDLREVVEGWYATIAEGQDIMPAIAWIQRGRCVCIAPSLIMR